MNTLTKSAKPILNLLKPTSNLIHITLFSTSSSSLSPSHNSSSSSSSYRRHDEESRGVRVSVWWDIENCGVPSGVNVFRIAHSITNAVRVNGIKGPVQINAFGDIFCINRANQEALSSTGVNLIHIPNAGGKNSADRSLLVDLMYWVSQNPPPAHIFLISGDRDFAGILHKLRMSNYNILLAARDAKDCSGVLYSAASVMWYWSELARGENLSGKHFNQPPDGPFNSWYGHYRGPLEDPFAAFGQQKHAEVDDSSNAEQSSDTKLRPIPIGVLRQLRRLVNSHADGLPITELRDQLIKSKVSIDKDFYGHKKFSRFLMALPKIVKVETLADGRFLLHPVSTTPKSVESYDVSAQAVPANGNKNVESYDVSAQAVPANGNKNMLLTAKANCELPTITRMVDVHEKPSEKISEKKEDGKERTVEEKQAEATFEKSELDGSGIETGKEALNAKIVENSWTPNEENATFSLTPKEEHNSKRENGILRKLWTKLFTRSINAEQMRDDDLAKPSAPSASPEKSFFEDEQIKSNSKNEVHDLAKPSAPSASPEKSISEDEQIKSNSENEVHDPVHSSPSTGLDLVATADKTEESDANPGFIAKIINWCKFWRNETATNKSIELLDKEPSPIEEETKKSDEAPQPEKLDDDAPQPEKNELFTKDSFWKALRSFFGTHRGSDIVLKSSSREQIAERLQKEGPLFLQSLQAIDIRHLVELLITEKKWIKEYPTKHPRFRLASPYEDNSAPTQPHSSAGLSSMFLNSESRNNPQLRVSSVVHKKPSEKTRTEILADCQKLLDEILSQNPDGFNISIFRKQFLDKYGYALDPQKLGYPKLVSLLQMMPGVKVESTRICPDNVAYAPGIQSIGLKEKATSSDSEMSDSARKEDDMESPFEELGPVSKSELSKEEAKSSQKEVNGVYEPSVIEDDDFSDTEEVAVKAEEQRKSKVDEEDSSLLQILDSWYSTKGEPNSKDPGSGSGSGSGSDTYISSESSEDETNPSGSVGVDNKGQTQGAHAVNYVRKLKTAKSYSFVVEGNEMKKGKMIDGILGTLKSGESRVHG